MTRWIENWFGSEYYSMLYRHRDCDEAKLFLDNLLALLKISSHSSKDSSQKRILDCGCGQGRHSLYLSEKGFEVTGLDISKKNILQARKQEKENLSFFAHDLRNHFRINYYDAALNLFTSFGYFENDSENNKVILSAVSSLKKNGWFVLDFMNVEKEIRELIPEEKIKIDGVCFNIKRTDKNNFVIKEILVIDKGKEYSFRENVKAYKQKDLENFFIQNKLEIVYLFGDYHLHPFNEASSERLIMIGKKQ